MCWMGGKHSRKNKKGGVVGIFYRYMPRTLGEKKTLALGVGELQRGKCLKFVGIRVEGGGNQGGV